MVVYPLSVACPYCKEPAWTPCVVLDKKLDAIKRVHGKREVASHHHKARLIEAAPPLPVEKEQNLV